MSYVFDINDETVWSPALRAGRLYTLMAQDVADVLGAETGMTAMASDFWDIDIDGFEQFVNAMYQKYFSTSHTVLKGLFGVVLAPSIVVLERDGRSITPSSPEPGRATLLHFTNGFDPDANRTQSTAPMGHR